MSNELLVSTLPFCCNESYVFHYEHSEEGFNVINVQYKNHLEAVPLSLSWGGERVFTTSDGIEVEWLGMAEEDMYDFHGVVLVKVESVPDGYTYEDVINSVFSKEGIDEYAKGTF